MSAITKTYIEFSFPGSFYAETRTKEVQDRTPPLDNLPMGCYQFRFFDITETVVDGEVLRGDMKNVSPNFIIAEAVYTQDDVLNIYGEKETLYSNMVSNNWEKVVLTPMGNFQLLEKDTRVVMKNRVTYVEHGDQS